jgi:hypothetical protein
MLKTTEGRTNQLPLTFTPKDSPAEEPTLPKNNKENSERVAGPLKSRFQELHMLSKKMLPKI